MLKEKQSSPTIFIYVIFPCLIQNIHKIPDSLHPESQTMLISTILRAVVQIQYDDWLNNETSEREYKIIALVPTLILIISLIKMLILYAHPEA